MLLFGVCVAETVKFTLSPVVATVKPPGTWFWNCSKTVYSFLSASAGTGCQNIMPTITSCRLNFYTWHEKKTHSTEKALEKGVYGNDVLKVWNALPLHHESNENDSTSPY